MEPVVVFLTGCFAAKQLGWELNDSVAADVLLGCGSALAATTIAWPVELISHRLLRKNGTVLLVLPPVYAFVIYAHCPAFFDSRPVAMCR